jgi:SlyX protein
MSQSQEERIISLETTVALQDRAIEKLNEAVTEQQRLIDKLEAGVAALAERMRITSEPVSEGEPDGPIG